MLPLNAAQSQRHSMHLSEDMAEYMHGSPCPTGLHMSFLSLQCRCMAVVNMTWHLWSRSECSPRRMEGAEVLNVQSLDTESHPTPLRQAWSPHEPKAARTQPRSQSTDGCGGPLCPTDPTVPLPKCQEEALQAPVLLSLYDQLLQHLGQVRLQVTLSDAGSHGTELHPSQAVPSSSMQASGLVLEPGRLHEVGHGLLHAL